MSDPARTHEYSCNNVVVTHGLERQHVDRHRSWCDPVTRWSLVLGFNTDQCESVSVGASWYCQSLDRFF